MVCKNVAKRDKGYHELFILFEPETDQKQSMKQKISPSTPYQMTKFYICLHS